MMFRLSGAESKHHMFTAYIYAQECQHATNPSHSATSWFLWHRFSVLATVRHSIKYNDISRGLAFLSI